MRIAGHILLWSGFLCAAFLTVNVLDRVDWVAYGAAVATAVVGVVLLRLTAKRAGQQTEKLRTDVEILERALAQLTTAIDALAASRESTGVFAVHGRIDAELVPDLNDFVAAREAMIHLYGLQRYADVMTRFAGAERMLNRAWSASADGYVDEVWRCIDMASSEMHGAKQRFAEIRRSAGAGDSSLGSGPDANDAPTSAG